MINTPSKKKYIILVIILALPGFLYYLLQEKGKNRYRPLPFLGPKIVASTFHSVRRKQVPDTLYHTVPNFKFLNQNGKVETFKTDSPKITVVNFFYTKCPDFCVGMNRELSRVVATFPANRLLRFFSISIKPEADKPEVLKEYSTQFHQKSRNWSFLTGDRNAIFQLANKGFLVDILEDSSQKGNLIHAPTLILTDAERRIRGYYDASNKEQVDKLIDEIKVLITEELRKVKDR